MMKKLLESMSKIANTVSDNFNEAYYSDIINMHMESLNEELRSADIMLTEDNATGDNMRAFLQTQGTPPIVGQSYNIVSIAWNGYNHNWLNIATNDNNFKLVKIEPNCMWFDINGKNTRFPASVTQNSDNAMATILFNSAAEKQQFDMMLKLKFADWKHTIKDFTMTNRIAEDEFYAPKDDGGRAMKNTLKWSEIDMDNIQRGLRDSDERLQDYYLAHLNYQSRDNRYNGMMKAYDKAARPSYVELNFDVDEGSGRPWPVDIQDGRLYGGGERYLGGFDDQENFISESMVAEDDLGVELKRPAREGARPARGHEAKPRYTTVAEDESVNASSNSMEFNYKLLGRLQADCEYFLHAGGGSERHLWAGSVADQIAKMKELYNSFPTDKKPQYITPSDIIHYENEMSSMNMNEATHPSLKRSPEERKANRELWDRINSKGVVPSIDRERYTDLSNQGLEGPFRFKSGRVVYYDPQEGKYYDRDRDMYLDNSESLGESDEETKMELPPHLQTIIKKHGLDKVMMKTPKRIDHSIKDVTPAGYGPDAKLSESRATKEKEFDDLKVLYNKLTTKMKDDSPLSKGMKLADQRDKVRSKLDKLKQEIKSLTEGWESGPEENDRPERDADHDYDTRRQEKADDKYEKNRPPTVKTYQCTGRGPNMEPNQLFGPEFAKLADALAYREKLEANPNTPHPEHIGINTYRRPIKSVTESEGGPVEAYGVKGLNSTKWQKTFRNSDALNKWVEANDAEMYGMREADPQYTKEKRQAAREDVSQSNIPLTTNAQPVTKELSELAVNPNKARPGQTADVKFNGWNIRYQLKPKQGSGEFKGMAVHSQSAKTPPVSATGTSAEDVLAQLKAKIASNKGSAEISASTVMVDFNVLVTRDIVGHNDVIYGDIVSHNSAPTLLISAENPGGMQRAMDRRANANKTEGTTGQHAFSLSGKRAHAAGLTHARYTLGSPENYIPGVTAYPLEFNSEVHPGEIVRLSSPGVTIAYPTKSAGVATESIISEYAGMNEIPKLRDRNDFKERMKTLSDIQLDPDTARDPQLKAEVLRKRAELMKQARDQGLSESWVVVDGKNKAVKMFESKTNAYNYVLENMFTATYAVKHRDEIVESNSTDKFGRALDKAGKDQSGDRTGMPSMEERRARFLRQQAEKDAKSGKKVVKEYGATSTGSPTSTPGASAVPAPVAPSVGTPPSSVKPVAPVAPVAPVVNPAATPGAATDAASVASAAASNPQLAAALKSMAANATRPVA